MDTRKLIEIIFREDLYPRIKADPAKIQEYAKNIDILPPIEINQNNELIDGYHRWTAHRKMEYPEIAVFVTRTTSDAELLELAIQRNATHGYQLSNKDKQEMARKLYLSDRKKYDKDIIKKLLSVSYDSVNDWLSDIDRAEREKRKQLIHELYLACYTNAEIAEILELKSGQVVKTTLSDFFGEIQKNPKVNYFDEDWKPPLYNVWRFNKLSNDIAHFGNSEQSILDNLLYLYTLPLDIVLDPFAGGGSTIDICKNRMRRYWVSDRKPIVEREKEIRQMDICLELPPLHNRWSDVSLTYLDPPYWKQAVGQYSEDAEDMANMPLEEFTEKTISVVKRISEKQSRGAIAMLMQPTQWNAPGRQFTDHIFAILQGVGNKRLTLENRVSCPYTSEQANAQMVDWAKENKKLLVISRELIIWKLA